VGFRGGFAVEAGLLLAGLIVVIGLAYWLGIVQP
jgi:hypothetical protein